MRVGDKVKIRKSSVFYKRTGISMLDRTNPIETWGVVDKIRVVSMLIVRVDWYNGSYNFYRSEDLIIVK